MYRGSLPLMALTPTMGVRLLLILNVDLKHLHDRKREKTTGVCRGV